MKKILILLLIDFFVSPVYSRPDGGLTDGSRINIQDFGFSIMPVSGMRIQQAGKSEPENYRFPWFIGKVGIINFALVSNSVPKLSLERAFEAHVNKLEIRALGMKYIGKFEHVTLKSGIEAIRAEFRGKGDSIIIRYYMHDSKRRVCFAHLMPLRAKGKAIEAVIRNTMKATEELSSFELKKAETSLRTFEFSGRGIPVQQPFIFPKGGFPRVELENELKELKKLFSENNVRLNIMMTNALKRKRLTNAELVVAVRSGRVTAARVKSHLEK